MGGCQLSLPLRRESLLCRKDLGRDRASQPGRKRRRGLATLNREDL